ncbi:MAG: hypothetical protein KDK36_04415, partial [Leptospiraceae bacterium]|nr:hypothetical protein [Leptospiraceae bacterium]
MKKYSFITLFIIFIYGCSAPINNPLHNSKSAEIIHEGVINCFKNEIFDNKNKPINCEASAVFLGVNSLIIAEDKEIKQENLSPVFSIPLVENFPYIIPSNSVTYLTAEPFINVKKIEDMT